MPAIGNSFAEGANVVIFGASGAIGGALTELLKAENKFNVIEASRSGLGQTLNISEETSIEAVAKGLSSRGQVDLLINCIGLLHDESGVAPEKNLKQLSAASLETYFRVNAIGPALLLKHFAPLMPRDRRSVFASLSARVGSLSDNRLGGWYGYRASKAAHNMILRTASIELSRTHPLAVLAAIHPGTVESRLSAPFAKGHRTVSPYDAARRILAVIYDLKPENSGRFYAYDGSSIPW